MKSTEARVIFREESGGINKVGKGPGALGKPDTEMKNEMVGLKYSV